MTPQPPPASPPRKPWRFGTARVFALVLIIAATIAGAEFYALYQARQERLAPAAPHAPASQVSAPQPQTEPPIGAIDVPGSEAVIGPRFTISGWALASAGVRAVELRGEGLVLEAAIGIARPDVAQVKPGYPDTANSGFEFTGDLTSHPAPPGTDRRVLSVVAIAKDGRETVLGKRSVIDPAALA
ncbi:MAG TPA: hypothetical protein VFO33_06960, partial [Casimicrobiaceae bacterium]|nr:hypothetical protein [Casimicrobiaceae bacterium]